MSEIYRLAFWVLIESLVKIEIAQNQQNLIIARWLHFFVFLVFSLNSSRKTGMGVRFVYTTTAAALKKAGL
jgi:hypothetical protein